jgi:transcriptional regulator with XRE-family HTH domain
MSTIRRTSDHLPGVIAVARCALGWSQAQLAKASGLSKTSISQYERGKVPSVASLQRIAAALGTTVTDLAELAAVLRRFQAGKALNDAASRPAAALLNLEREIADLLLAEARAAG